MVMFHHGCLYGVIGILTPCVLLLLFSFDTLVLFVWIAIGIAFMIFSISINFLEVYRQNLQLGSTVAFAVFSAAVAIALIVYIRETPN